jgi:hypothetical protein
MIDAKNKNKLRKDRITHVDKSTRIVNTRQSKGNKSRYVIKVMKGGR